MTPSITCRSFCVVAVVLLSACHNEPTGVSSRESAMSAAVVKLPKTGQGACYDAAGAMIACAGTGQDGELLRGGSWPSARFTDQGNGVILDRNTGLVWTKDANGPGPTTCLPGTLMTWQASLDYVKCLNANRHLGFADWRLPNVLELRSLVHVAQASNAAWLTTQGYSGVQLHDYWSSSSAADGPSSAWVVGMDAGDVDANDKSDSASVWPVRSDTAGLFDYLTPRTGQTRCYDAMGASATCMGTGQDGAVLKGVAWPDRRFVDLQNGTMGDNLTGLVWSKDTNAPGPATCTPAATKPWQAALDYVRCLNASRYLGFTDWRLPNRNELNSLVHHAQLNQAAWLVDVGFAGVQAAFYWSSSTVAGRAADAWGVDMGDGDSDGDNKSYNQFVWPVRSGP